MPVENAPREGFVRTVLRAGSLVLRSGRRLPIAFVTADLVVGVLVAVELLLIRDVAARFLADDSEVAVASLVLFGVASAGRRLLASASTQLRHLAGERVQWSLVNDVLAVASAVDFQRFEDPKFQDRLTRAMSAALGQAMAAVSGVLRFTTALITAVSLLAVLVSIAPSLLAPFAIAGAALTAGGALQTRMQYRFSYRQTSDERERIYLRDAVTSRTEGKEARLFGSRRILTDRFEVLQAKRLKELTRLVRRRLAIDLVSSAILASALVFVFWRIAVGARDGTLAVEDAAVAAIAAQQLAARLQTAVAAITSTQQSALFLGDMTEFVSAPAGRGEAVRSRGYMDRPPERIRLEGVSYSYPDTTGFAVQEIDLTVELDEVVALVGENGSGKSTIAKLLSGLYEPDVGVVSLERGDESEVVAGPLVGLVTAVFQDFARYELTLEENVWLGAPWLSREDATARQALSDAGAAELLESLPHGLRSRLGRQFEGGVDLSIGEWQRVAIARGFFSPAPFIVMDEPTSSLDPNAEADLVQHLRKLSRNRGVLLITHRYATVRAADRIIVMNEGRIVEQGSHDALMSLGGVYASLYRTQAQHYL